MLPNCVDNINSDLELELQVVTELCELIDTPRSLAVYLLVTNGEFRQYLDLPLEPGNYESSSAFADDYLVSQVLRKSPNLPLAVDRKQAALESFLDSEAVCSKVNTNARQWEFDSRARAVRKEFREILGPLTPARLQHVITKARFGPGSTTGVGGVGFRPSEKYEDRVDLTTNLIPFVRSIMGENWWEHQRYFHVVEGGRLDFVPKNAEKDRTIDIQPTLCGYVQLGVGSIMRSSLKRAGIDLRTQAPVNRWLAKEAYYEDLCTIDLSSASDRIAWSVPLFLMDERWFHLLELCRTEHVVLPDGTVHELQKISSMGNGFTFELETLFFLSVVRSIVPSCNWHLISVFGDDIICPQEHAREVIEVLELFGSKVNEKKSFLAGNFFESCGKDYFRGIDVRPFYLRGRKDKIPYALQIANSLRLYSLKRGGCSCDSRYREVWKSIIKKVPKTWRNCRVPPSLGDTGLIVSSAERLSNATRDVSTSNKKCNGREGWLVKHIPLSLRKTRSHRWGVWLAGLANISGNHPEVIPLEEWNEENPFLECQREDKFTKGYESRRGLFRKLMPKRALVHQWPEQLGWSD